MSAAPEPQITQDRWLGERLLLLQPRQGHRSGTDALLLACALGADRQREPMIGLLVDVGAGVGAVGLSYAEREPRLQAILLENHPLALALAQKNIESNGLSARARVIGADLFDTKACQKAGLRRDSADYIVSNPPFYTRGQVRASPDAGKAYAHITGDEPLQAWLNHSIALLRSGGLYVAIHRADALAPMLEGIASQLGAIDILPIAAREGEPARRILLRGRKGSRTPLRLLPPLALHGADGRLLPEITRLGHAEALLEW